MIDINNDFIEITNPHDAALLQIILDNASYTYKVENATIHLNYTVYPDDMSQEEIAESRRLKKEYARQHQEKLNAMSKKELALLKKDESVMLIDEDAEMDCWAIRFIIEEKDLRFLSPDQQLHAQYTELLEKYNQLSNHVDHPYEDFSAPYPFVYKAPKNPNLESFQQPSKGQLHESIKSELPVFKDFIF